MEIDYKQLYKDLLQLNLDWINSTETKTVGEKLTELGKTVSKSEFIIEKDYSKPFIIASRTKEDEDKILIMNYPKETENHPL